MTKSEQGLKELKKKEADVLFPKQSGDSWKDPDDVTSFPIL